jgi:tRNA G18 (ribose-2'-O)-methylase SpoU
MHFSKEKFLRLPFEQQHKKCAEMLRGEHFSCYSQATLWLQLDPVENTPESLSNRYHFHIRLAKQNHKEHNLLPKVRKGDKETSVPFWPITIYLDQLRSAHNVGSILRTVEALRLGEVVFSQDTPGIECKKVKDTSMGAWQWVPTKRQPLNDLPRPIICFETVEQSTPLHQAIFPESFTLVVGNEEFGVSQSSLELADFIVEIPLRGQKNSLNVASCFAMGAYEIFRQRNSRHA